MEEQAISQAPITAAGLVGGALLTKSGPWKG